MPFVSDVFPDDRQIMQDNDLKRTVRPDMYSITFWKATSTGGKHPQNRQTSILLRT